MSETDTTGLRLLSLDGGGIRGFSTLLILRAIMHRIKVEDNLKDTPNPCDYFDLIGGTSTGGIIALMLGRLRMSVEEAIYCYDGLAKEVFSKLNKWDDEKYKAELLEEVIKAIVKKRTGDNEAQVLDDGALGGICKTFVCTMEAQNLNGIPVLFRTYVSRKGPSFPCTVWQAARATSAAPKFFERVVIGDPRVPYIGVGVGGNNPTAQVLEEAEVEFPGRSIACVISIGTGKLATINLPKPDLSIDVVRAIVAISIGCEKTAEDMEKRFKDLPKTYFRFNVHQGLNLGDWDRMDLVAAYTQQYMETSEVDQHLATAVQVIRKGKGVIQTSATNSTQDLNQHLTIYRPADIGVSIQTTAGQMHDDTKKAALKRFRSSEKTEHKTVIEELGPKSLNKAYGVLKTEDESMPPSIKVLLECTGEQPPGGPECQIVLRSYLLVPRRAEQHLIDHESELEDLFVQHGMSTNDFAYQSGFDDSLVERNIGLLELVKIYTVVDIPTDSTFARELIRIIAPFPILYQASENGKTYKLWDEAQPFPEPILFMDSASFVDLLQAQYTTRGNAGGSNSSTATSNNGPESSPQKSRERKKLPQRPQRRKKPSGEDDDSEEEDGDRGKRLRGPSEDHLPSLRFTVNTKVYPTVDELAAKKTFQILTGNAGLTIKTDENSKSVRVDLGYLQFSNKQEEPTSFSYKQALCCLAINSHNDLAHIEVRNGFSTPEFTRESTKTDGSKQVHSFTGTASKIPSAQYQYQRENNKGHQRTAINSRIRQDSTEGKASWTFHVDDYYNREDGYHVPKSDLPAVSFFGPVKPTIDIELASYWSLTTSDKDSDKRGWRDKYISRSRTKDGKRIPGLFKNLVQVVVLEAPSPLTRVTGYTGNNLVAHHNYNDSHVEYPTHHQDDGGDQMKQPELSAWATNQDMEPDVWIAKTALRKKEPMHTDTNAADQDLYNPYDPDNIAP